MWVRKLWFSAIQLSDTCVLELLYNTHTHTHTYSWLHGEPEATVCDVSPAATTEEPNPQDIEAPPTTDNVDDVISTNDDVIPEFLSVRVILTEAARSKFQARFYRSVRMIQAF